MINKWILNNFKSINQEKTLEFRPLTIFTGANSSGKSTILQSILLVTQTLQNQNPSRSIVLNGGIKKFGNYTDVVFGGEDERNIKIGFSLFSENSDYEYFYNRSIMLRHFGRRSPFEFSESPNPGYVECNFEISSAGITKNLQPELESMSIKEMRCDKVMYEAVVSKWQNRTEVEQNLYDDLRLKTNGEQLKYTIKYPENNIYRNRRGENDWKPIGVFFNHFLPESVIMYCSSRSLAKEHLREYLLSGSSYILDDDQVKLFVPIIEEKAMEIVKQLYDKELVKGKNAEKYYVAINKKFTLNRLYNIFRSCALEEDEKQKLISQITEKLSALKEKYKVDTKPIYHLLGKNDIEFFFRKRIKYLGPLREEPKSIYPLSNDGSTTEVGLKGENTAAVYCNNRKEKVKYVNPDGFSDLGNAKMEVMTDSLEVAVKSWLIYMGVANDVDSRDQGKIGHTLQITNDIKGLKQDLTHVGVGVSQVLPILVMSLLAKKGDVIILEQPELHLHPKVQTRLADFFVSMNALGKQCIVETHSEYLINRLRYLVAVSTDMKVADDTMIYFVEKDKEIGYSKYRQVTINKYGVIEDWPEGFFDESEKVAMDILRAGMAKKAQEEGDNYEE